MVRLSSSRLKGVAMVVTGATLWGLSGTVAQHLFQNEGFRPEWMVAVRLLVSGWLLLTVVSLGKHHPNHIGSIWRNPRERLQLLCFGLLGMLGVQYTYFAAIDAGNAATATLLQYLGPVFITCFMALRFRKMPDFREWAAVGLALMGTYLLVTGGSPGRLTISGAAFFWGIGSAVALAFYTLYPSRLLRKWGSAVVVGWGMVIGGTGLSFVHPPWIVQGTWSLENVLAVIFVIVFGTLIPFYLYLDSLRYISPAETGLLASAEPLTAAVAAVVWLKVPFGIFEWAGGFCIISTIVLLSRSGSEKKSAVGDRRATA